MTAVAICITLPTLNTEPRKSTQNLHRKKGYEGATCNNAEPKTLNAAPSHPQTKTTLLTTNEKPNLLKRREATLLLVGGASIGTIASIVSLPYQFAQASEVASSSCEFTVSPSGLAFCDKFIGTGPQAVDGQLIKAHYTGRLENGKVFDSSYNRGKPLTFRVGAGEVIKGWDQGILGIEGVPPMLAGGKRTLMIPPVLGYGMRGAGCRGGTCIIPPNSVLFFDVEFLGKI